jgi:hypothetical protein
MRPHLKPTAKLSPREVVYGGVLTLMLAAQTGQTWGNVEVIAEISRSFHVSRNPACISFCHLQNRAEFIRVATLPPRGVT